MSRSLTGRKRMRPVTNTGMVSVLAGDDTSLSISSSHGEFLTAVHETFL